MLARLFGGLCSLVLLFPVGLVGAGGSHGTTATSGDLVIQWNDAVLQAIAETETSAPTAARNLAMVHLAMFDAVNSVQGTAEPIVVKVPARRGASATAAAVSAAHRVLTHLYPRVAWQFDTLMTDAYMTVEDEHALKDGVAVGREVADRVIAMRSDDNAGKRALYVASTKIGQWAPTPPSFAEANDAHWSSVRPYALSSPSQFRPEPPPSVTTGQYAKELEQVRRLGALNSTVRTDEQTDIARFWNEDADSDNLPVRWNRVAQEIASRRDDGLLQQAKVFAALNVAMADAAVASWDAKFRFNQWRPVSAIRNAENDGNPDTAWDDHWEPLLDAPGHPGYVASHAVFSGAASEVLVAFFGDASAFSVRRAKAQPVRRFTSLKEAAEEAGESRVFGGVDFPSSYEKGLELGERIGKHVVETFFRTSAPNNGIAKRLLQHLQRIRGDAKTRNTIVRHVR